MLLAERPARLQEKLDCVAHALHATGLSLNPAKSFGLTIAKGGKRKYMAILPTAYTYAGASIHPLGSEDSVRYLGLQFNWKGRVVPKHTGLLEGMLRELSQAPLKPHQRLKILKFYLVPKFIHELVLGHVHRNTLVRLDRQLRSAVRLWLRLPSDTPLGYFHSHIKDGGLGVPCFSTTIPLLQKARLEKVASGATMLPPAVLHQEAFQSLSHRINQPCMMASAVVTMKEEVRMEWRNILARAIDGRDLCIADVDGASHEWLLRPSRVFPRLFIRGIQLRGGVLSTKSRSARGSNRKVVDRSCQGACRAPETLNHILQVCETTHDARCACHNRVLRHLAHLFHRDGVHCWVEPIIPSGPSFIKPDLVVDWNKELWVLDVAIVSGYRLRESWDLKIAKYGREDRVKDILTWAKITAEVKQLPVIFSNRGLCFELSGGGLRTLGLGRRDIMDLCLLTIRSSLQCYDVYQRGTRAARAVM